MQALLLERRNLCATNLVMRCRGRDYSGLYTSTSGLLIRLNRNCVGLDI
jgi:hypothetical protein